MHLLRNALKNFIVDRVLSDATVLAKYTKGRCKIPSGKFEVRYRAEMRSLVLSRLLNLIFLLDRAKKANIIDKAPRLFAKNAPVKSSRDMLLSLSRDFLSNEGDVTKHLSRIGLKVSYKQEPIDELDMIIRNFAVDLRDGIRLTRMAEIVCHRVPKSLLSRLRLPPVSRLQKLHNVTVALNALKEFGVPIPDDIVSHHIVDGHRSMVLKLMWTVIGHCCFPSLLELESIEKEIEDLKEEYRRRFKKKKKKRKNIKNTQEQFLDETVQQSTSPKEDRSKTLILQWCQGVCRLFDIEIKNFTTSFADGKAMCLLVHYYHPQLLSLSDILPTTKDLHSKSKRGVQVENARNNERANSALANSRMEALGGIPRMVPITDSSTIPDEKSMIVYLCYAFSRLISSRREVQACSTIQVLYRCYIKRKMTEKKKKAASLIYQAWKLNSNQYYLNQRSRYIGAVKVIEDFVLKRYDTLKKLKAERIAKVYYFDAAVLIQVRTGRKHVLGSPRRSCFLFVALLLALLNHCMCACVFVEKCPAPVGKK